MSNSTFSQKIYPFYLLLFQLFLAECKVSGTEEKCYCFDDGKNVTNSDFSKPNNVN